MGKVGAALLVVAGAAIQFIPGVGNFVGSTLISAGLGYGGATIVAGALVAAGLATALSIAQSALFSPSIPRPEASDRQVRNPTPLRTYIEGIRRSYGALVLFETSGTVDLVFSSIPGSAVDVLAFADGRGTVIAQYLNDDAVTISGGFVQQLADERYRDNSVQVGFSSGAPTETAFAPVVALLPGIWTTDHRGDGVVSGYMIKKPVSEGDFLKTYPQGDNISLSAVVQSHDRFDPRLPDQDWSDDLTWAGPFDNPLLALLRYLVIVRGEDYDTRILPVIDYWIEAADICDSARALKAGGTEKLYRCAIMWDSSAKPSDVISEMLKTFDGWLGEDEAGHIIPYAGKLYTPTVEIGPAQIVDYEVKSFVEDEDRLNEVIISYVSAPHDYNIVEASAWRDETDIAERGHTVSTSFAPQVPSHAQGQYLAKRYAAKANAQHRGTVSTNYSGRAITGERYIHLMIEEAGATFFDGIAEILTIERNVQTGGVTFTWVSVPANLDSWIPAVDEGDPAALGDRVPLEPIEAPEITSATPDYSDIGESGGIGGGTVTGVRIIVTATGPDRPDLTWYARWRVGAGGWSESTYPDADPSADALLTTTYVPYGTDVDIQVGYSIGDGRFSGWSATEVVDTSP